MRRPLEICSPKIMPKRTLCLSPRVVTCCIVKNCIVLILMQKCNKFLNNIVVYPCSNCCLEKIGPTTRLQLIAHQTSNGGGNVMTLFKKHEGSLNSKHNNFACLCSHLNGTKLHHWRRTYQMSSESTCFNLYWIKILYEWAVEWSVQYINECESSTCCVSCHDVVGYSVTFFTVAFLFTGVTTDGCPKEDKSSSLCSFSVFCIKFGIAWLDGDTEFRNSCIKSSWNVLTNVFYSTISQ